MEYSKGEIAETPSARKARQFLVRYSANTASLSWNSPEPSAVG